MAAKPAIKKVLAGEAGAGVPIPGSPGEGSFKLNPYFLSDALYFAQDRFQTTQP